MDEETPHTAISMACGQVVVTLETSVGWTPEMMEDALIRIRRQVVGAIQDLGLVGTSPVLPVAPVEDE